MLDYMTVKHVHARVIGELKLELEVFPRDQATHVSFIVS